MPTSRRNFLKMAGLTIGFAAFGGASTIITAPSTKPKTIHVDDIVLKEYDAFIPELWAKESLAILEENMTIGNLICRDFSDEPTSYDGVVNTV